MHYKEGVFVGYRYNDTFEIEPQFCFGHGLSYTTFAYSDAKVQQKDGKIEISCKVKNTGTVFGKETVQVYLAPKDRRKNQPLQELKGFEKVTLEAGGKDAAEITYTQQRIRISTIHNQCQTVRSQFYLARKKLTAVE